MTQICSDCGQLETAKSLEENLAGASAVPLSSDAAADPSKAQNGKDSSAMNKDEHERVFIDSDGEQQLLKENAFWS
jgi:hypothetical protein